MGNNTSASEYFDQLLEIERTEKNIQSKYARLRILLEKITKDLTRNESVQFSNLFSRLSFVCDNNSLPKNIHGLRIIANKVLHDNYKPEIIEYKTHLKYLSVFISKACDDSIIPKSIIKLYPNTEFKSQFVNNNRGRKENIRAKVKTINSDSLICVASDNQYGDDIIVSLTELEKFSSIRKFWAGAQVYLVNIQIDKDTGHYFPKFIILEPDYVINITSIAESFQDYGTSEIFYLKSKFEKNPNSKHIRLGNFANLAVDKIISEGNTTFNDTIIEDFKSSPFEYTTCDDLDKKEDFQQYHMNALMQFENIKQVIENDFNKQDISLENIILEPSFISELYGIQGRLDILELSKNKKQKIIELKSGSVAFPDDGKTLKPNHRVQLYLYLQLISLLQKIKFHKISEEVIGYIMYSKVSQNNLRSQRPTLKEMQTIFNQRNNIIINEYNLTLDDISITKNLISQIKPEILINRHNVNQKFRERYLEPQIYELTQPFKELDDLENDYFHSFLSFIAKEEYLSKIGDSQNSNHHGNGLANLWLNSFSDKIKRHEILYDLSIETNGNLITESDKTITFIRTNDENEFVNFRQGDICILYPRNKEEDKATSNQVFKCSISKITKNKVIVYFRYSQANTNFFNNFKFWALERDSMDSSFTAMYRNLYSFISHKDKFKRQLILTTRKPIRGNEVNYSNKDLSNEQNRIIKKALSAKHYFLLNGPPGTGKTSMIIRELIDQLYKNEKANILLIAYTNRAVDEICDVIKKTIGDNFIRIGNELSCSNVYKNNLLSNIISSNDKLIKRKDIKDLLIKNRVYVSTVASITNKMSLFKVKNFDTIIVDEASQILEPQIIGIIQNCDKFIMIGDHKQLPAIVLQNADSSKSKSDSLKSIGLLNRKNSLFERLYKYCESNDFEFAFDKLSYQGRMHKEIALFPNHSFYDSSLKQAYNIPNLSDKNKRELERQDIPLSLISSNKNTLEDLLSKKRLIFFSSEKDNDDTSFSKKNKLEAELVIKIVQQLLSLYSLNNKPFNNKKTIGIIAPFRNQIALIKQKLEEANIPNHEDITVDTIERYQGSQRDIIILSFAINNEYQLDGIINTNDEMTVDRKLNVALTRAREQLILLGNDSILSNNLIYFKLIEFIKTRGGYISAKIKNIINNKYRFDYFDDEISIEGKTYSPDDDFNTYYNKTVIDILKNDTRTKDYPNKILGESSIYIRNNIIEYGRSNFDEVPKNNRPNISPIDKVNLYCYYNMRKHYFSTYSIFDSYRAEYYEREIDQTSGRVTFIDFGCGPLTSGCAFNQVFKDIENYKLKYIGIDISNQMLEKAKEFSGSGLFNKNSEFNFYRSINETPNKLLEKYFKFPNTVILNFSYLFSNLSKQQSAEYANDINKFVKNYPLNKYIIIYQNPVKRYQNFDTFKEYLHNFDNQIVRKSESVSYKNQKLSKYDKEEFFTYEILTN